MSRLTDLIGTAKAKDPALGQELEREFQVLSSRRSFGLNFERHRPESVELPGRLVRKGDKVRVLPPRGMTTKGDQRLWKVLGFESVKGTRLACLELLNSAQPETQVVAVDDLSRFRRRAPQMLLDWLDSLRTRPPTIRWIAGETLLSSCRRISRLHLSGLGQHWEG